MGLSTDHLALDRLGRVFLLDADGDRVVNLGHIDWDADWPASQGREPAWFQAELNELVDRWDDAERFSLGCESAAASAYSKAIGV